VPRAETPRPFGALGLAFRVSGERSVSEIPVGNNTFSDHHVNRIKDRCVHVLTMPNPKMLRVGDRVRFITLPDEWLDPVFKVPPDSVDFMKVMISRSWPSRVYKVDEFGIPWIAARIRRNGRVEHHTWGICEESGWRTVRSESKYPGTTTEHA
jgi:hypothetical protein